MTDPDTETARTALVEVLAKQSDYEQARQSRLGQGAERLTAPIGGMVAKLIPPEMVRRGLEAADRLAAMTLPKGITGHAVDDVAACEAAALRVQAWAAGSNAVTGGVAGLFGAGGMAFDIPATISLAARNVRATGAAYGFAADNDDERAFRLMVLEVATSSADARRKETLRSINEMAAMLDSPEGRILLEKGGEWLSVKVVERIARQLSVNFAGRGAAGRVVPIVGGAVAAVVNASFQTDVARAARYAYRQRWLMARRLLHPPRDPS